MKRITITAGTGEDASGQGMAADAVERALGRVRVELAARAGGYTEAATQGGWIADGRLVQEPGRRFTVIADDDADPSDMARMVGRELHQRAVALEVEPLAVASIVEV